MLAIIGAVLALVGFLGLVHVIAMTVLVAVILLGVGLALVAYSEGYARPRRRRRY